MKIRQATCSCTQLNAVTEGEPVRVSICHCRECQRRTGNVFGVQARFPRERVKVAGRFNRHARTGDSGERILFHFCPHCGSTVYYWAENAPETIGIPVGAFADRDFPPPTFSVYEERMHPWVLLPEGIEHMD
ncbi:MAG: GFA family protein [Polyangiaceae bacterium]